MSITKRVCTYALAFAMSALLALPTTGLAAQCDCGRPLSSGAVPSATDCLVILKVAVGLRSCGPPCGDDTCNVNGDASLSATDALACLKSAVGTPGLLNCPSGSTTTTTTIPGNGPPPKSTCSGAEFFAMPSSDLDAGWTGLGHNAGLIEGASIAFAIARRCGGTGAACVVDSDCSGESCDFTCDCDSNTNTTCEVTGPTDRGRCQVDLQIECDSSADCPGGQPCWKFFGPPLPLNAGGTPTCVTTFFADNITGTADSKSGESDIAANLRSRVHLGISLDQPCPRCGALGDPNLSIGSTAFTCEGGPQAGQACTVGAISSVWGGLSSDCPPAATANVSGQGLVVNFSRVTTGTVSKQATLPCADFPSLHPSGGGAVCLDDFTACSSNADCTRCVGDPTTACASDADCAGSGPCAEAPAQPISCGLYCHCGFCDGDPDKPCFGDDECSGTEVCSGTVGPSQSNANSCKNFICGLTGAESCCTADDGADCSLATGTRSECSILTYIECSSNADCPAGAGVCNIFPTPCFENEITRSGVPSPLGSYCADDPDNPAACTSNADCAKGACESDTSRPSSAALFCLPPTASPSVNGAGGIPGPGAILFDATLRVCRCGNSEIECDEACDDGNNANGDGCDEACRIEP